MEKAGRKTLPSDALKYGILNPLPAPCLCTFVLSLLTVWLAGGKIRSSDLTCCSVLGRVEFRFFRMTCLQKFILDLGQCANVFLGRRDAVS